MSTSQTPGVGPTLDHLLDVAHGNTSITAITALGDYDPQFPDFPKSEYVHRWAALSRLMDELNVDAVVFSQEENIRYLSGYNSVVWEVSKWLPCLLLATRNPAEAVLIASAFDLGAARGSSWVPTIDGHFDPSEMPSKVAGHLERLGLNTERIGAEIGNGAVVMLPWPSARALMGAIGDDPVDFTRAMSALRMVKSPAELARIRTIVTATTQGYREAIEAAHIGMTERELVATAAAAMYRNGATAGTRPTYLNCVAGRERHKVLDAPASDYHFVDGDIVFLDGGGGADGYMSDIIRLIGIGNVSAESEEYASLAQSALEAMIATARPGATASELFLAGRDVFEAAGLADFTGAMSGHGIGMDLWERPFLRDHAGDLSEEAHLRPGMVMSMEPMLFPVDSAGAMGIFVLENQVLVTETGVEVLSGDLDARLWKV